MAGRLSRWLYRVSSGPGALAGLAVFLLFAALVLPGQSAAAERVSGEAGSPDMSFVYAPGALYRMAEAYGPEGRAAYVRARWTFDLAWPFVYTLFLATAISRLFGRGFPVGSPWRLANLAPLLGALFDYLENTAATIVMLAFPARVWPAEVLAAVFTPVKWVFVVGSFVLLVVGVVARLRRH